MPSRRSLITAVATAVTVVAMAIDVDAVDDGNQDDEENKECIEFVIADFDFASDDAGDLPFFKGDRIGVLEKGIDV